jgi:hypothetical protein
MVHYPIIGDVCETGASILPSPGSAREIIPEHNLNALIPIYYVYSSPLDTSPCKSCLRARTRIYAHIAQPKTTHSQKKQACLFQNTVGCSDNAEQLAVVMATMDY